MNKKVRLTAICLATILASIGFILFIAIQGKWKYSSSSSQCAQCGCSRHVKIKFGRCVQDVINHNDLSNWLSGFRTGNCQHIWIPVSGWNASDNVAWDGISLYNSCLERIRELEPANGESVTKQLLIRYDNIVHMEDGQEKNEKFREFYDEIVNQ